MVTAPNGDVWLEKRPSPGIWGGLWCFPEVASREECSNWCLDRWGSEPASIEAWDSFRHTFSHYHLDVTPIYVTLDGPRPLLVRDAPASVWYQPDAEDARPLGLSAVAVRLLSASKPASLDTGTTLQSSP